LGKTKDRDPGKEPLLWLPFAPEWQFCILPQERQRIYISRFLVRFPSGGWLMLPKFLVNDLHCIKDRSLINEFYQKIDAYESDHWILEKWRARKE